VAGVDQDRELLPAARRFKDAYDLWADAVDRCAAALLRANTADPLHDRHGLRAAGHAIKAAATLKNISHAVGKLSSELFKVGLLLLPLCPELAGALLAASTMLAAAQLAVDLARKGRGEPISWLALGGEAMAFVPGGKIAGAGAKAIERSIPQGSRTVTRLVPGGGLAAHEGIKGSHTLAKHVGKDDAFLLNRLIAEPKLRSASTFADRETAENAMSHIFAAKQGQIEAWLAGAGEDLKLTGEVPFIAGRVIHRGSTTAVEGSGVRMILRRDDTTGVGFRIHTAMVMT
jgi:hypothetical protein